MLDIQIEAIDPKESCKLVAQLIERAYKVNGSAANFEELDATATAVLKRLLGRNPTRDELRIAMYF